MVDESKLQKGELKSLSKILMKMQSQKNDGKGILCVQMIAKNLKKGNINLAKKLARCESEILWNYPEIRRFIHDVIEPIGYWDVENGKIVNCSY